MDYAAEQFDTTEAPISGPDYANSGGAPVDPKSGDDPLAEQALVSKLLREVKLDKKKYDKDFKRMRRNMFVAKHGREETWSDKKYFANIIGRHIKQKTAALYAKNPKAVARRRETLDFQLWDESEQSLMIALQTVQAAAAAQQMPMMAAPGMAPQPPQIPPGFAEAQALIADFQQGMERRKMLKGFGRTLEILFSHSLREQKPLDVKTAMKQVVRRACTTGVAYVELDYQRETGPSVNNTSRLNDFRARLEHLKRLSEEVSEGEIESNDAEMAELQASIAALESEPEIVLREGLVFDFPLSTRVIPDRNCKSLVGFVGSTRVTIEYLMKKSVLEEMYGVDLGEQFTAYHQNGSKADGYSYDNETGQGDMFAGNENKQNDQMICLYKIYDKEAGLVYYVVDGYKTFIKPPAPPNVQVSDFWPLYALTFNAVESEEDVFPPSDVELLLPMQREYNRSRDGKRLHRQVAMPRWAYSNGALDETDIEQLKKVEPFDAVGLSIDPTVDINKVLMTMPVPGVDPNLYDVNEVWADMQVVGGTQQAMMGGLSKATATEASISANSSASSDGSSVDDLDAFLTMIARGAGEILMKNCSDEYVQKIVGPGAIWPAQSTEDVFEELYLEVEAGSSGKPNQAVEINNWQQMLPFLLQMGSIPPTWLARETLRRLDDRMDLTEAVVAGIPSVVAQNSMAQPSTGDAATSPDQQGAEGANNAPAAPGGPAGSSAPMGDNHTTPAVVKYGSGGQRIQAAGAKPVARYSKRGKRV